MGYFPREDTKSHKKINQDEVVNCVCGGKFKKSGKSSHFKTKMHNNFMQNEFKKFKYSS